MSSANLLAELSRTKKVSIGQAETELSKLSKLVESGQQALISRDAKPVARLVPVGARPIAMKV